MNFTESFSEFSSKIGPTDLALYAGAGIILWVLFKDKMTPVQKIINDLVNNLKGTNNSIKEKVEQIIDGTTDTKSDKSLFFDLVVSWKQTRDLAEKSGCAKAVEVADQMFPYLSPMVCEDVDNEE
jgi:hypothetical protein